MSEPESTQDRVATLTATLDQLQLEHDRLALSMGTLGAAVVLLAVIVFLEHRRLAGLLAELLSE